MPSVKDAVRYGSMLGIGLGLVFLLIALGTITIWKPSDTVSASTPKELDAPFVFTAPGLLETMPETLTLRAVGAKDDTPVTLAIGRTQDVQAWAQAKGNYATATEFASKKSFRVEITDASKDKEDKSSEGDAQADPKPLQLGQQPPADQVVEGIKDLPLKESDMWIRSVEGVGSVEMKWSTEGQRCSVIAASDGSADAPVLQIVWKQKTGNPAFFVFLALGIVAIVGSIVVFTVYEIAERRSQAARMQLVERAQAHRVADEVAAPSRRNFGPRTRRGRINNRTQLRAERVERELREEEERKEERRLARIQAKEQREEGIKKMAAELARARERVEGKRPVVLGEVGEEGSAPEPSKIEEHQDTANVDDASTASFKPSMDPRGKVEDND
ncbi:MAG: hypothetical protein Q4G30_05195 [Actinomycetaceae bacterium]|nr:hypothetical protein [Actinomycetaceae bacterium]